MTVLEVDGAVEVIPAKVDRIGFLEDPYNLRSATPSTHENGGAAYDRG